MTWVYLHYTVAHSKSFTSVGDYWHERQQPRCCIYGSVQTVLRITLAFLPNAPNLRTGVCSSMAESTHLGVTPSDLTSSQVSSLSPSTHRPHAIAASCCRLLSLESFFVMVPSLINTGYSYGHTIFKRNHLSFFT